MEDRAGSEGAHERDRCEQHYYSTEIGCFQHGIRSLSVFVRFYNQRSDYLP
jgi:hypothetical protein